MHELLYTLTTKPLFKNISNDVKVLHSDVHSNKMKLNIKLTEEGKTIVNSAINNGKQWMPCHSCSHAMSSKGYHVYYTLTSEF